MPPFRRAFSYDGEADPAPAQAPAPKMTPAPAAAPAEVTFRPEQITPVQAPQASEATFSPEQIRPVTAHARQPAARAATPPPVPSAWSLGWERAKSSLPGGQLAGGLVEGAADVVRHPIRNLPYIGAGTAAALAGPPGWIGGAAAAGLGAAGGEGARQIIEAAKNYLTGAPPERTATTPGGVVTDMAHQAVTSGVVPEVVGRGIARGLSGPFRPPPGSPDEAVAATSKEFGLGLTLGETRSSIPGRTVHGIERMGDVGTIGHATVERGRAAGEARATDVLGAQLDAIHPPVSTRAAGESVVASAKDAEANLLKQHLAVQHQRELAHGQQEMARRAVHTENQQAAAAAWNAVEAEKATQFRTTNQATFNAALTNKQAAGRQMATVAKQVTTPVDSGPLQARAQQIIDEELRPPAEAYPRTVPETPEGAALTMHAKSGASVPFESLSPDAQAYLREAAAMTGDAVPTEIDPLEYASTKVRDHLTRIANAQPTADFGAAWQYYSDLLADSKFLKALKSPGEGQLSALAQTLRGSLETAAKASGVDWASTSAAHASAADAAREAAKGLNKRYTPKPYRPQKFKSTPFVPDKFSASANLQRMLTDEPSQLLAAFSKNGQVVPERIAAARETLLKTAAGDEKGPSTFAPGPKLGALVAPPARVAPAAVDPAANEFPLAMPAATPPPSGPFPAPRSPAARRGQQAWDQLRTALVRDQILTGPMHELQARLQRFGPDGLKELFPDTPQIPANLQRIGDAFARRGKQPNTWPFRTLEVVAAPITAATSHFTFGTPMGTAALHGAAVVGGLEGIPAIIAWAAHSPRWTNLLLNGINAQVPAEATANFTRLVEAYRASGGQPEPAMAVGHQPPPKAKAAMPPPGPG